jgi:predicted nucleotidyltransferase
MGERVSPPDAAAAIADERYPTADLVILAGSVSIGRATPTSDLDLVVVSVKDDDAPYRESFTALGWPAEGFVHTPESVRAFIRMELAERERSMARMVSSGLVIRDTGKLANRLRAEAQAVIDAGPPQVDDEELALRRYGVTDGLDDVRGDPKGDETLLTAANLAREAAELHLTLARAWIGTRKWLLRELRETDPAFADRFVYAIRAHAGGDVTPLMALAGDVLEASGGPLFDGYRASGKKLLESFERDEQRQSTS